MGAAVIALLTPLLPVLVEKGADALQWARRHRHSAEQISAAERLWELLRPHLTQNQLLAGAFDQLARHPEDEEATRLAALSLEALFSTDRSLAEAGQYLVEVGRDQISAGPGAAVSTGSGIAVSGSGTAVGRDYVRIDMDPWDRVRSATGRRRAVILGGLATAIIGFAVFMAGVFTGMVTGEPSAAIPLIVVGFVLTGLGGVVASAAAELFGPRD